MAQFRIVVSMSKDWALENDSVGGCGVGKGRGMGPTASQLHCMMAWEDEAIIIDYHLGQISMGTHKEFGSRAVRAALLTERTGGRLVERLSRHVQAGGFHQHNLSNHQLDRLTCLHQTGMGNRALS